MSLSANLRPALSAKVTSLQRQICAGPRERGNVFRMYTTILMMHSWLRWVALLAGVAATIAALRDDTAPPAASRADKWGLILMITLDIQLLLGLLMYLALSPMMTAIRENFGASMKDPAARF